MKINFVYHTLKMLGSGWMGSEGLKRALEKNGYLDYVYNQSDEVMGSVTVDIKRLRENPIFFVRGFLVGRMPIVARAGNQFKATWNSESVFSRHGTEDASTPALKENYKHFNMMFTCAESDLNYYKIPTYFLPSWCDTSIFDEAGPAKYSDRLAFIGGVGGREDFLNQDSKGIIHQFQTKLRAHDPVEQTRDYAKAISEYEMLVSPPGRAFNGMCGRAFEIMGCKRLAFVYLNPDTMFKHMEFFADGIDCVYFRSYEELADKFEFYKKNLSLVRSIAASGYKKVREFHNENIRAKYIVDCMKIEHEKWLKDQELIPEEINALYTGR